jgi:hypothetical protein
MSGNDPRKIGKRDNWTGSPDGFDPKQDIKDLQQSVELEHATIPLIFKCAHCGKDIIYDSDEANWYENQKEFINDQGELETWMKVQHHDPPSRGAYPACGMVSYLIFKGKLDRVETRN